MSLFSSRPPPSVPLTAPCSAPRCHTVRHRVRIELTRLLLRLHSNAIKNKCANLHLPHLLPSSHPRLLTRQNSLQAALPSLSPHRHRSPTQKQRITPPLAIFQPHPMLPSPPFTLFLTPSCPLTPPHASRPGPRRRSPLLGRGGGAVGLAAVRLGDDGLLGVGPRVWGEARREIEREDVGAKMKEKRDERRGRDVMER